VLIDTIQRFKGLESQIVILWGLDTIDLSRREELLYVGMSRAKSLLVVVGTTNTCNALKARIRN
jgi:superfamily I DNA and RNA helicase